MTTPNFKNMPAGAIPVYQGVASVAVLTASGQVKTGAGVFGGIFVGIAGSGATVSVYDGTSTSGTLLWTMTANAQVEATAGVIFANGLYVDIAATTAPTIMVGYF